MTDESIHIPIAEEELSVGVKRIVSDRVRVRTETTTVTEHATTLLEHAEVEVTRVPIGEEVSVAPKMRVEGNVTIVPVMEEILVVEKRLVLKEEIRITRSVATERVELPVTSRKQNALVERDAHPQSNEETKETMESYDNQRSLTAFYRDRSDAEEATRELAAAGIAQGSIHLVPGKESDSVAATDVDSERGGFWDALSDFFFPSDDREVYAEGLRRGGYLVTVNGISESQHAAALDILDDEGTIDVDEWSDSWKADGWAPANPGFDKERVAPSTSATQAASTTEDAFAAERSSGDEDVIPVVEEQLRVGKRDVNNGSVRVRSYVVETPVKESVSLRDENVSVERRSVDRPLTDADAAFQERTISAEEHREEAVVSKEARIKEEILLRKTEEQRTEYIDDSVRHTEVEVEDERGNQVQRQAGQTQTLKN